MAICDVLIAVDSVNKDIIAEAIEAVDHTVEVCEGHTFFILKDIEMDLKKDRSLVSVNGALEEIGEQNYSFVRADLLAKTMRISGNPMKFGVKALLTYGEPKKQPLH